MSKKRAERRHAATNKSMIFCPKKQQKSEKYGKIMPHCMAKELPVCNNVTLVVDFSAGVHFVRPNTVI